MNKSIGCIKYGILRLKKFVPFRRTETLRTKINFGRISFSIESVAKTALPAPVKQLEQINLDFINRFKTTFGKKKSEYKT